MRHAITTFVGKAIRKVAQLRGGGSALPGLVVERIDASYMTRVLERVPLGVVVVSGTNGKTSTTKMISEVFESRGLRVFTNRTGSNFTRGVVSAILAECTPTGRLNCDIAVLELDEAHARHFVDRVTPFAALLLNVFVDQVERFSNVNVTLEHLQYIADHTTDLVVVNADDPFVSSITAPDRSVTAFGLGEPVAHLFPSEDQVVGDKETLSTPRASQIAPPDVSVTLERFDDGRARFRIADETYEANLRVVGAHNAVNAAAALTLVRAVLQKHDLPVDDRELVESVALVESAQGRGEQVIVDGDPVEFMMVKNPAGFRLSLLGADGSATMVAVNNQVSDGADVSWLTTVDFSALAPSVEVVSGSQAEYASGVLEASGVEVKVTLPDLERAFEVFLERTRGQRKQIYASYTAIMQLRRILDTGVV